MFPRRGVGIDGKGSLSASVCSVLFEQNGVLNFLENDRDSASLQCSGIPGAPPITPWRNPPLQTLTFSQSVPRLFWSRRSPNNVSIDDSDPSTEVTRPSRIARKDTSVYIDL